jgi:hypothetical protein
VDVVGVDGIDIGNVDIDVGMEITGEVDMAGSAECISGTEEFGEKGACRLSVLIGKPGGLRRELI